MITTFTGTWHNYYTVTRHLVLLNSYALELLYSWTPVIGRLLTFCSWYYTPVDPRNWIILDIRLLWIPCGHYHWTICNNWTIYTGTGETDGYRYSFHVYGGHTNVVQLISWDSTGRPPGVSVGCTGTPTPLLACRSAISPWAYARESGDTLFLFERILSSTGIY